MDEAFPIVVEPEVLNFIIVAEATEDGWGELHCHYCEKSIDIGPNGPFSVMHILYLVKKHIKEFHT